MITYEIDITPKRKRSRRKGAKYSTEKKKVAKKTFKDLYKFLDFLVKEKKSIDLNELVKTVEESRRVKKIFVPLEFPEEAIDRSKEGMKELLRSSKTKKNEGKIKDLLKAGNREEQEDLYHMFEYASFCVDKKIIGVSEEIGVTKKEFYGAREDGEAESASGEELEDGSEIEEEENEGEELNGRNGKKDRYGSGINTQDTLTKKLILNEKNKKIEKREKFEDEESEDEELEESSQEEEDLEEDEDDLEETNQSALLAPPPQLQIFDQQRALGYLKANPFNKANDMKVIEINVDDTESNDNEEHLVGHSRGSLHRYGNNSHNNNYRDSHSDTDESEQTKRLKKYPNLIVQKGSKYSRGPSRRVSRRGSRLGSRLGTPSRTSARATPVKMPRGSGVYGSDYKRRDGMLGKRGRPAMASRYSNMDQENNWSLVNTTAVVDSSGYHNRALNVPGSRGGFYGGGSAHSSARKPRGSGTRYEFNNDQDEVIITTRDSYKREIIGSPNRRFQPKQSYPNVFGKASRQAQAARMGSSPRQRAYMISGENNGSRYHNNNAGKSSDYPNVLRSPSVRNAEGSVSKPWSPVQGNEKEDYIIPSNFAQIFGGSPQPQAKFGASNHGSAHKKTLVRERKYSGVMRGPFNDLKHRRGGYGGRGMDREEIGDSVSEEEIESEYDDYEEYPEGEEGYDDEEEVEDYRLGNSMSRGVHPIYQRPEYSQSPVLEKHAAQNRRYPNYVNLRTQRLPSNSYSHNLSSNLVREFKKGPVNVRFINNS